MQRGARRACGRTWSPTAATSSCSGSRTASRGCGWSGTATAARRRRRRSSSRSRRRSRRPRPTSTGLEVEGVVEPAPAPRRAVRAAGRRTATGRAPPAWTELDGRRAGAGLDRAGDGRRRRPARGERRRHAARLPQRVRRLRRAARRRADDAGGTLTCPACERRFELPRAGRSPDDERAAARAGAAAARRGPRAGGGRLMAARAGARRRPAALRARAAGARRGRGPRGAERCELCPLVARPTTTAPAPPRGAADRLRLRDLLVDALGRGALPADRLAHALARAASSCPTSCGRRSRSRSAWRSSCARPAPAGDRRPLPEPGGRDRVRARPRRLGRARARRTRCSSDLEPDAEALIVNRLATPHVHAIAPLDDCYRLVGIIKATLGGHQRRRGDGGGRRSATSTTCARRRRCDERRGGASPPPRGSSSRCSAPSRSSTRRRRACASTCTSTEPEGREVYTIALSTQIHIDPARRSYDDATRERLVELFGPPERWGATTHSFQWARVESLVPGVHRRRRRSRVEVPCTYDLEVASAQVLRLAARRRASRSVPLQRHGALPRRATTGCRSCSCRGAARRAGACRSTCGGATIDAPLPGRRLDPAAARDARARCARARPQRGLHTFDDTVRGAAVRRRASSELVDAALRGLRALPVHAGRDEERDADAVRDRLPAGLRGRRPAHVRPRADAARARAGGARRSSATRRASSSRAASATRASSGGSSSGTAARRLTRRRPAVRVRRRAGPRAAGDDAARRRARAGGDVRPQHDRGRRRASIARGALRVVAALDPPRRARAGRPLRLADRPGPTAAAAVATCDHVNIFPVLATAADDTRPRRGDRAARPPADRAREPRRPVRRDRDRGGAAAARARAQRRRARGDRRRRTRRCARCSRAPRPRAPEDDRAAARPRDRHRPAAGAPARAGRRRRRAGRSSVDGVTYRRGAQGACCAPASAARRRTACWAGRTATIERIYLDYEDGVHLARDGRRRPRPGADARHRPLPVLQARRGGGGPA